MILGSSDESLEKVGLSESKEAFVTSAWKRCQYTKTEYHSTERV